jgi:hypothetical protein
MAVEARGVHVGRTDGQSPSEAQATNVEPPGTQRLCTRQLTVPVPSAASITQQATPAGQSVGLKQGSSTFSQWSDSNIEGAMQVAFSGAFVTQQTWEGSQTFVPHINEASTPPSPPDGGGEVKSQL